MSTNELEALDEDIPQLSAETFNILQQFYAEQAEREEKIAENINSNSENITFVEDWQLSQFWYDKETITNLTNIAINSILPGGKIVLISCPSLYNEIRQKSQENDNEITLLEFDKRFEVHQNFVFYDYKDPLNLPENLHRNFDLVICDPPFLSEECLSKVAETIKLLAKEKILLCTGATMEQIASEKLGLKKTEFYPKHENNLANEFCCYSNYDISTLI